MKNFKKLMLVSAILASSVSGIATAATDGIIDLTSTGTANLDIAIPNLISVKNLNDIAVNWSGSGAINTGDSLCVGMNFTGTYSVSVNGSGTGNIFTLQQGGVDTIPYSVSWGTAAGATTGTALASGVALGGVANAGALGCTADNSQLIVDIASADLLAANVGTHSGVMTILVAPQ